ncbi:MAG: Plug domain-containing protein, partial [Bacteroidales bacterium]|nr:Plug domain-containing protein [Bacteroidales bacterium]
MKKLLLLLSFIVLFKVVQAQEYDRNNLILKNISLDSLSKIVKRNSGYNLYFGSAVDSLAVSLECNVMDLLDSLPLVLGRYGYGLSTIGYDIIALKGSGLIAGLPDGYFKDGAVVAPTQGVPELISANTESDNRAENKANAQIMNDELVYSLKGAVLSAESTQKIRSTQIGLERVRIDRIKHVPAAFGEADVMKVVLTLPGVKSVGESSGGFNVRGGATDQNLILFNEGTLYNPTHLFGLFSAFNPDVVSDIELYKSTIPAKYGGRISSVLEINSKNGNNKKISGSAGIGLLTGKIHLEGPLGGEKTTFIAGLRTTYSNWILKLLPEDSGYNNGTASFNDFT